MDRTFGVVALFSSLHVGCASADHHPGDALRQSIAAGDLAQVTVLIESGQDLNAHDYEGKTPLYYAAQNGKLDIVEYLISRGANVAHPTRGPLHEQPVHAAAYHGHPDILRVLISHGAPVNARTGHSLITPLHMAAGNAHPEAVQLLLDHGADVDARDNRRQTPLHLPFPTDLPDARFAQVLSLLLDHGADVNAKADVPAGFTPLMQAASNGMNQCVQLILSRGADPRAQAPDGTTALALARRLGHADVVELIARHASQ